MLKIRVIPSLLIRNNGLIKTIQFKDYKYVGDPLNAVKIFNDKEVDELIFLDTRATADCKKTNFELIRDIATEAFMPVGYGGGINNIEDAKRIISCGIEKVVINSYTFKDRTFIKRLADCVGNQSVVCSVDVKKNFFGKYEVWNNGGRINTKLDPVKWVVELQSLGAGEIFLNSIDRDGTMKGYDIDFIKSITSSVDVPVIACGGAGCLSDFKEAVFNGGASAVSAGSFFVFHGKHKAVLITYPNYKELKELFNE